MISGLEQKIGGRPTNKPDVNEFAMLRSGMTNKQLAEHYNVSVETIQRWARNFRKEYANGTKED